MAARRRVERGTRNRGTPCSHSRPVKRDKAEKGQHWAVARIRYTQVDGGGPDPN